MRATRRSGPTWRPYRRETHGPTLRVVRPHHRVRRAIPLGRPSSAAASASTSPFATTSRPFVHASLGHISTTSSKPVAPAVATVLSRCEALPLRRANTSGISTTDGEGIVRSSPKLHASVDHGVFNAAAPQMPLALWARLPQQRLTKRCQLVSPNLLNRSKCSEHWVVG